MSTASGAIQKPEPDPLSTEEVNAVLDHMKQTYNEQVLNYFEFAIFTGMRPSELIELKWGDTDAKIVTVRRAKVEGKVKGTKTNKVRHIELNERAKLALGRQAKHTKLKGEHIFNNPVTSMPWNDDRAQAMLYWTPSLKAKNIRERVAYQCRHTFATIMLMSEANPMWVSRQMGHSNMKMLLEVYSKWIDLADKSKEINKVNLSINSTILAQDKIKTS